MEDLLKNIRELKTKAKNRRDLERYESAASFLEKAIQLMEKALTTSTEANWKAMLFSELADCYGLLGGIKRRWGLSMADPIERSRRLRESFFAYNRGYHEYEAHEELKISNSYNLLNRLVSFLLFNPSSLNDAPVKLPDGQILSIKNELESAEKNISYHLALERRGDIWALADLALVNLLLDRESPSVAYASFIAASPPDYAYESSLSVLRPLASLQLPIANKLRDAVKMLEDNLYQLRLAQASQLVISVKDS